MEGDFQDAFADPEAVNFLRDPQRSAEPGMAGRLFKALFQIGPDVQAKAS
jgi:hypothetical protein